MEFLRPTGAHENGEKKITQEYLAAQTFESLADTVPLDAMMDNGEMAQRGIDEGIWMRICAGILQDDDKPSVCETITKSAEKISDSKGLVAIGNALGRGIAALAIALFFVAMAMQQKWGGRLFPEPRCFELQDVAGRVFKVTTCTGD